MLAYSTTNTPEDGPSPLNPPDHDDFGLKQSKVINVIGFIMLERDAGGKVVSTFPHPALKDAAHFAPGRHFERLEGMALQRHSKLASDKMGHASTAT